MEFLTKLLLENIVTITGIALVVLIVGPYLWLHKRHSKKVMVKKEEAEKFGLHEPITIHPKVDRSRCIGSGACIKACPEKEILGTIYGKAETVYASRCVGHGACAKACPVGAITLVFGSEKRGVDIPDVSPRFETNVRRLFIAGELGGMGLISNAITQGQEAVEYIAGGLKEEAFTKESGIYDLVIVGAGPAGISASLQAMKLKLNFITLDQEEDLGGAILTYPRAKLVMTKPMNIPIYGKVKIKELSKEQLIDLCNDIVAKTGLAISASEKVLEANKLEDRFLVKTSQREILARYLLLCIGRRGTPRKLGVPGEKQAKVMYRLLEPEKFEGKKMLVVGGGDSAVEAAVGLAVQKGTEVTLSYRKEMFSRIKEGNQQRVENLTKQKKIKLLLSSNVLEIKENSVSLEQNGNNIELPNDYVFVFAGGELPNDFLKKVGINIVTKYGTR